MTAIRCFLLDHGYTNQTSGPCCMISDFRSEVDSVYNFRSLHRHPRWIEIKQTMDKGAWHPSCDVCRRVENIGKSSMRNSHSEGYRLTSDTSGLVHLTVITGTQCNIQCRSCGPWSSSSWKNEYRSMPPTVLGDNPYSITIESEQQQQHLRRYHDDDFRHVKFVNLLGGEPLYNPECFGLLEKIAKDTGGDCKLLITTNSTIKMDFKKFPFLETFRELNLILSIDAVGPAFEFIRTGAKWDRVVSVIDYYKSLDINLAYHLTHSVMNIFTIPATQHWLTSYGVPAAGVATFVDNPSYLSFEVLTDQEKETYKDFANTHNCRYIYDSMISKKHDPKKRKHFFDFMEHTKLYHGLDWATYLPELYEFVHTR